MQDKTEGSETGGKSGGAADIGSLFATNELKVLLLAHSTPQALLCARLLQSRPPSLTPLRLLSNTITVTLSHRNRYSLTP